MQTNNKIYSKNLTFGEDEIRDSLELSINKEELKSLYHIADPSFIINNQKSFKISGKLIGTKESSGSIEKSFYNTYCDYQDYRTSKGNIKFQYNFDPVTYSNILKNISHNQIPPVYLEDNQKKYLELVATSSYSPVSNYEDVFLSSSDIADYGFHNSNILIKESYYPYYNKITIPNPEKGKKSSFSIFLKNYPQIEKDIYNSLTSSKLSVLDTNSFTASVPSLTLDKTFKDSRDYKLAFDSYNIPGSPERNLYDFYKLEKTEGKEIVGFKILKYSDKNNILLNQYYLSNLFNKKTVNYSINQQTSANFKNYDKIDIDFIDTQIKFGESYRYEIKIVMAVNSYKYNYNNIIVDNVNKTFFCEVVSEPIIEITELPYFTKTVDCIVAPQVPEIDVYTKVQNDKELLFTLNIIQDEQALLPLKNEDLPVYKKYVLDDNRKTKFYEGNIDTYEIYRIQGVKPTSLNDFADKLYKKIPVKEIKNVSFKDYIDSNIKYYYLFRCLKEDLMSNPSDVFEIELVNLNGGIYSKINIIKKEDFLNIKKENLSDHNKSFKRYLALYPNPAHLSVNDSRLNGTNIPDGLKNHPGSIILANKNLANQTQLWGKKFKIRVTSKSTGKKIDFDIAFDKTDKND
jgi:hypothetical protein